MAEILPNINTILYITVSKKVANILPNINTILYITVSKRVAKILPNINTIVHNGKQKGGTKRTSWDGGGLHEKLSTKDNEKTS